LPFFEASSPQANKKTDVKITIKSRKLTDG